VLFDETVIALPDEHGWSLVDDMIALLTAGATKDEIGRGEYESGAWTRCRENIIQFERAHSIRRHGSWFKLAIWLAQRDEAAVAVRLEAEKQKKEDKSGRKGKRKAADANGGDDPMPAIGIPVGGGKPAEALGPAAGQDAQRSAPVADARGMGDAHVSKPATPRTQQLGFAGFD
jgi:hypothetical protein